ncbi:phage terminase small subunit P27 family [Amycolatopsis sp. CA-128772]|uniref:phage terminase small subunit P27 family n=1 Tax=Amycolatopsis sp. CA-128772 TaxID=2073159 RepID=UPI000CD132E5|nr:phage terminase small subunit P27 family [Amycolatopsis sp. CA-128772]
MARPGRAPKPTALKLLDGTRADRINQHEPLPRGLPPAAPAGLADDVRDVWDYTVRELDSMGIAFAADRDALVCYCEAVVTHRRASELLAVSDVLVTGLHGGQVRNPALQVQRDAAAVVRGYAQEFGLTPSARTRIEHRAGPDGSEENPFAGTG